MELSIKNFETCCRLCAHEQDVTLMIFGSQAEAMHLQNKLKKYLSIQVSENDKLPKHICIQCCNKLHTVCNFIDTAHQAQEILIRHSSLSKTIASNKEDETNSLTENKYESAVIYDNEQMEIGVDLMQVLQNTDEVHAPCEKNSSGSEDVTFLHGVDGENVTIKLMRKPENENVVNSHTDVKEGLKPFPCKKCTRSFCSESALKNHSWVHNFNRIEHPYKCISCVGNFDTKTDLIKHLKQHKNGGPCQLCYRTFRSDKSLRVHMAVHLSPKKTYLCSICGRSYKSNSDLKTHSITHINEWPYPYPICKKSFGRNQDLMCHMHQHTGEKPFRCSLCPQTFITRHGRLLHHSKEHPQKDRPLALLSRSLLQ